MGSRRRLCRCAPAQPVTLDRRCTPQRSPPRARATTLALRASRRDRGRRGPLRSIQLFPPTSRFLCRTRILGAPGCPDLVLPPPLVTHVRRRPNMALARSWFPPATGSADTADAVTPSLRPRKSARRASGAAARLSDDRGRAVPTDPRPTPLRPVRERVVAARRAYAGRSCGLRGRPGPRPGRLGLRRRRRRPGIGRAGRCGAGWR